MEEPFLILGKEANFESRIDGYLLVKVWWIELGVFILEVTQAEVAAGFRGKLYWGTGQTGIALDTREAARDWVEQEAKRRAREMVELVNMAW